MLPSLARFSQSRQSRSSWLIAIRSTLQPYGCQEELSTWLKEELLTWPRHRQRRIAKRNASPVKMTPLPDRVLDHLCRAVEVPELSGTPYEFEHELGRGGMGVVYQVR